MKNQYYGDINDYKKYAYLRHLVKHGNLSLGINWYLTEDDGSSDGRKTSYLDSPRNWKHFDEDLFSRLHHSLRVNQRRSVAHASDDLGLDSSVSFFAEIVPTAVTDRETWLSRAETALCSSDVIFLDPDNGLEVPSVPMGRKMCSKFAFDRELKQFFGGNSGRSLIIYQHFPRKKRDLFMDECSQRLSALLGVKCVIRIRTSNVLFIVLPSREHRATIEKLTYDFGSQWKRYVTVSVWGAQDGAHRAGDSKIWLS